MSRLYEEVRIRLEEMSMITSRTLKRIPGPGSEIRFCPLASGTEEFEVVELVRLPRGWICYDYRQGACFEFEGAGSEACPSIEGTAHETTN